jgi:hypothetical protein
MAESAEDFIAHKKPELLKRRVYAKDIGRKGRLIWEREAVTMRPQSNYPEKVFMVERMRLMKVEGRQLRTGGAKVGDREYRFGYYTVSRTDKWWWVSSRSSFPLLISMRYSSRRVGRKRSSSEGPEHRD